MALPCVDINQIDLYGSLRANLDWMTNLSFLTFM